MKLDVTVPRGTASAAHSRTGAEAAHEIERRIQQRIDQSGPPERNTLEAFEFPFQPNLDEALVMEIAGLDFARRKEDLVVTGKSGTGKSHILQAIALRGCQAEMSVRHARCVDALDDLYAGLADGTYQRLEWISDQSEIGSESGRRRGIGE